MFTILILYTSLGLDARASSISNELGKIEFPTSGSEKSHPQTTQSTLTLFQALLTPTPSGSHQA